MKHFRLLFSLILMTACLGFYGCEESIDDVIDSVTDTDTDTDDVTDTVTSAVITLADSTSTSFELSENG